MSGLLGALLGENLLGDEDRVANEWRADVAEHVVEGLGQLLFRPPLSEGELEMDLEFGVAARRRVGDDADEGTGLDVEAGAGPKGAEDRLRDDVDEALGRRALGVIGCVLLEILGAAQLLAHRKALFIKLTLRHHQISSTPARQAHPTGRAGRAFDCANTRFKAGA